MNVSGLRSSTFSSPSRTSATCASKRLWKLVAPGASARASITAKPTLWRVPSYFFPGLPRPTTIFMVPCGWGGLFRLLSLLFLLLADDFGFGRLRSRRGGRCRLDQFRSHLDQNGIRIVLDHDALGR